METYNIIAIGGTGMRCAESFVHLCAMGMFDDKEINLLALDTDYQNGNFDRLNSLVNTYSSIADRASKDTLFSAKINYYSFSPEYHGTDDFNSISRYSTATSTHDEDDVKWKESDIVDLFLTKEMRDMNLEHGYRAQTQMGSMLMYYAIIEEAYKAHVGRAKNSRLVKFIEYLMNNPGSKVFLFGSVFGGTGASSIPILPRAFQKAAQIIAGDGSGDVLSKNIFGTVMLTNYFSFDKPKNQGDVVAASDKFALNSQAALFFYHNDKTIRHTFKRLYLIGREKPRLVTKGQNEGHTGGKDQRNPADYIELLAASAAYDFFTKEHQSETRSGSEGEILFRTLQSNDDNNLTFNSFFGEVDGKKFQEKCGIMMASAFVLGPHNFAGLTLKMNVDSLSLFFRLFYNLEKEDEEKLGCGWIKQLQESVVDDYAGFLFHPDVFSIDPSKVKDFSFNDRLFPDKSDHKFKTSSWKLGSGGSKAYDAFNSKFFEDKNPVTDVANLLERTYKTFHDLYKF